jgi:hypothetical protein
MKAQFWRKRGSGQQIASHRKNIQILSATLIDELSEKTRAVCVTLEKRQQTNLPDPRCDVLIATYVLGLTTPFCDDWTPDQHLDAIRTCLVCVMSEERATEALLATPPDGDDWYANALEPIEAIGRKDGHALFIRYAGADATAAMRDSHSYRSATEMNARFKQEPAVTS